MNGYLVVLRHSIDDLPLMLLPTHEEAMAAAQLVQPNDGENVKQMLSIDARTPICVWVYSFADGLVTAAELVKEFAAESEPV